MLLLLNLVHLATPLLMQHSHSTLTFNHPILLLPHFISHPSAPSPLFLVLSCFSKPPASSSPLLTHSGFFNGMLEVSEPGALNYYTLSHLILLALYLYPRIHPVDHICIQESNLNPSSSFQISVFSALQSDCTYSQ